MAANPFNILKNSLNGLVNLIIPTQRSMLKKEVSGCKTLLDVGCGSDSPVQFFPKEIHSVGIDSFQPSIDKSRGKGIHAEYHKMEILEIGKKFKPKSFDCVLASDVIEHLTKEDGIKLIRMMEKLAKVKTIIFTPNGFLPQGEYDNNPGQLHKSGWAAEEMERLGYKVTGINGWKPLRGEFGEIKLRPKIIWKIVSRITQMITRYFPKRAFQIMCVKRVENAR